ncbi:MAG: hypothetical protein ABIA67_00535 [Candidatus Margulisiibacteriota bacterium]
MHKKTKHTIWILMVVAVIISFAIFMVVAVPEANTMEEVQEMGTVENTGHER